MATAVGTQWGYAIPPAPRHSISTHMPKWEMLTRFVNRDPDLMNSFQSIYPRMIMIQPDLKNLMKAILDLTGLQGQTCHIFTSSETVAACKDFAMSSARGENALTENEITIRAFQVHIPLYVVFTPKSKYPIVHPFWVNTGTGISSRLAEECMKHIDQLHEVDISSIKFTPTITPANTQIRERIANLLERAPVGPPRTTKVSPDDIYLFQTGMSAIYNVHRYLLSWKNSTSVLFGFAFHSTIHILEDFGPPGSRYFGIGDTNDLSALETHLKTSLEAGTPIQAIWTEFPSNPLIAVPDLSHLHNLARTYNCVLIVDDTIGSFANIDVLPVADVVITSLTKSFSGYADVMAGSAVLNPNSDLYSSLKPLFTTSYLDEFSPPDAITLELNSRNYLSRTTILNTNAAALVAFLSEHSSQSSSPVRRVYYVTTDPTSLANYTPFMRKPTPDLTPGYGCLFSVEFVSLAATMAFYDALDVHNGPHLGAHRTIALPYTFGIYGKDELEWAKGFGLRSEQVRIAVGLEDTQELIRVFARAVEIASNAA